MTRAAAADGTSLVVCDNLVKIYQIDEIEVVALQGLDLEIRRGEMMAIIGASGSGKSSLLNIIGGLDRPSAGQITVNGRNLLKAPDKELEDYRLHDVGFVWQQSSRNLIPYLTAQENVELPMIAARDRVAPPSERARELLDAVDLAVALHLHRHRVAGGVAAQQVHRSDGGRELAAHQSEAVLDGVRVLCEERLHLRLDTVLLQTGVGAHLVGAVVEDLLDPDDQRVAAAGRGDPPDPGVGVDHQPVGSIHPVERLVGAAVGVDRDAAVGLDHDEAHRLGQVRGEPPLVVDGAAGDHEPHRGQVSVLAPVGCGPLNLCSWRGGILCRWILPAGRPW